MDPPELMAEDENVADVAPTEQIAPPKLSPVLESDNDRVPAQVIFPNIQDVADTMDSLNLENHLPSYNVKEKIIIAIDTSQEDESTCFLGKRGENVSPFYALKSAVEMFVKLKQGLNKNHEFAIILLNETKAYWHYNFTSNIKEIVSTLNQISEVNVGKDFDLTSLFTDVASKIKPCNFYNDPKIPPPYVVRVVLLYSRSHIVPNIELMENIKELFNCPYFFLDVLATHEPVSESNKCKQIFQLLQSLDVKGYSYFFNIGRNLDALMRSMVKLAGHPLQRPIQRDADYTL